MNEYILNQGMSLSSTIRNIRESLEGDAVNESFMDTIKVGVLASMLAIPGIVDAATIEKGLGGKNDKVSLNSNEVDKKLYNLLGEDRYNDVVIVNVIARTLYREGRGDGERALKYIADVIWNRAIGEKELFIDVIHEWAAFDCWRGFTEEDMKNFKIKIYTGLNPTEQRMWDKSVEIAKEMVNNTYTPTSNYNMFYGHNQVTPRWASAMTSSTKYKNHTYGYLHDKDVERREKMADIWKRVKSIDDDDKRIDAIKDAKNNTLTIFKNGELAKRNKRQGIKKLKKKTEKK